MPPTCDREPRRRARQRRLVVFLALAALLHAPLLYRSSRSSTVDARAVHRAPQRVRLVDLARPAPTRAATAMPVPNQKATRRVPAQPMAALDAAPKRPATPASETATPTETPEPAVQLFPAGVIAEVAEHPSLAAPSIKEPTEAERVNARLEAFRDAILAYQEGDHGPTPELRAFGEALAEWFTPDPMDLDQAGRFGIGATSMIERYLRSAKNYALGGADGSAPALQKVDSLLAAPGAPAVSLCFGLCESETHQVAELVVVIDIDHDASGVPIHWKVAETSGTASFDADALSSLAYVVAHALPPLDRGELHAAWSRWAFVAQAYYWDRKELMLDPTFIPPGRVIEEKSGVLGKSTMTRQTWLVAVRYRDAS